jgi:ribosome biogenesis protein BMS1
MSADGPGGGGEGKKKRVHKGKKDKTRGKKAKRKQNEDGKKRHNPKAFTFSGGTVAVGRKVQHSLDKSVRKEHAPILDKTPDVAPPYVIVVHGPQGVGKTTLIRSLVRNLQSY